mmetsp:Transcript_1294/g.2310  ORF Transcript_1294/g.2310 Transcript_1294/m.2310 type:complete len:190 (-) Transcript_1294:242-811(-)
MQAEREGGGEEEAHRQHVRRVVVEVQVLVAGVGHPVQMADDPVGEAMPPGTHQQRPDDDQGDIGQDGDREREGHVVADAELAADLDLAQRPRDKGPGRADGDQLPQAALHQRRHAEPVFQVRWGDADLPEVPGAALRGAPDDQQGADEREERRGHAKEPDIEGAHPEVEQVASQQRSAAHAVLSFEVQH